MLVAPIFAGAQAPRYTLLDLGTLGGTNSGGRDINERGRVVGGSELAGRPGTHAFRTAPDAAINPATDDLGTVGGRSSYAQAVNESGQAAGEADLVGSSVRHAFRTGPNAPIVAATDDLGTLGGPNSGAVAINDVGVVVGWSDATGDPRTHAFIHFGGGPMLDLNTLVDNVPAGWKLTYGYDVNNRGQIAGVAAVGDNFRGFLLTPVPEPHTVTTAFPTPRQDDGQQRNQPNASAAKCGDRSQRVASWVCDCRRRPSRPTISPVSVAFTGSEVEPMRSSTTCSSRIVSRAFVLWPVRHLVRQLATAAGEFPDLTVTGEVVRAALDTGADDVAATLGVEPDGVFAAGGVGFDQDTGVAVDRVLANLGGGACASQHVIQPPAIGEEPAAHPAADAVVGQKLEALGVVLDDVEDDLAAARVLRVMQVRRDAVGGGEGRIQRLEPQVVRRRRRQGRD